MLWGTLRGCLGRLWPRNGLTYFVKLVTTFCAYNKGFAFRRSLLMIVWKQRVNREVSRPMEGRLTTSPAKVRSNGRVPTVELGHWLTCIREQLVERRFRWFGHAPRRSENELIRDLFLSTQPFDNRKLAKDKHMKLTYTFKEGLQPQILDCARWVKISNEFTQDRHAWAASVRGAASSVGGTGSSRPGPLSSPAQITDVAEAYLRTPSEWKFRQSPHGLLELEGANKSWLPLLLISMYN